MYCSYIYFVLDDATDTEYKDLASEIKILIHIGKNSNVVNLLGACTKGGSLFAILEYCPHGDLKTFLKNSRGCFSQEWTLSTGNLSNSFTIGDAMYFAYQIIKGMTFLHEKKVFFWGLGMINLYSCKKLRIGLNNREIRFNGSQLVTTNDGSFGNYDIDFEVVSNTLLLLTM